MPFTDPDKLRLNCGIEHTLVGRAELSADFIYRVIQEYGGTNKFYGNFYFTSMVPLGFMRKGKNLNYYDDRGLLEQLFPSMATWMTTQVNFGADRDRCICLGSGKNLQYLSKLNEQHRFFKRIDALDHPRFIMQYSRKTLQEHIYKYIEILGL